MTHETLREALEIIAGFLQCPEIADCAPEDKDPETDALERRARAALSKHPAEGEAWQQITRTMREINGLANCGPCSRPEYAARLRDIANLSRSLPVSAVEHPAEGEMLPCDVMLAPGTVFRKGVALSTLLGAFERRRLQLDGGQWKPDNLSEARAILAEGEVSRTPSPAREALEKRLNAYVGYPGERQDIRALVIEQCARVADNYAQRGQSKADKIRAAYDIAAAIRALLSTSGEKP